jgi:hypothetical protein
MPRKPRNYAAEYAARKARAEKARLTVRQTYNVRSRLGLPKTAPLPTDTALRREAREWSRKHSYVPTSKYSSKMPTIQVIDYLNTFARTKGKKSKVIRKNIWEYSVKWRGEKAEWDPLWKSEFAS